MDTKHSFGLRETGLPVKGSSSKLGSGNIEDPLKARVIDDDMELVHDDGDKKKVITMLAEGAEGLDKIVESEVGSPDDKGRKRGRKHSEESNVSSGGYAASQEVGASSSEEKELVGSEQSGGVPGAASSSKEEKRKDLPKDADQEILKNFDDPILKTLVGSYIRGITHTWQAKTAFREEVRTVATSYRDWFLQADAPRKEKLSEGEGGISEKKITTRFGEIAFKKGSFPSGAMSGDYARVHDKEEKGNYVSSLFVYLPASDYGVGIRKSVKSDYSKIVEILKSTGIEDKKLAAAFTSEFNSPPRFEITSLPSPLLSIKSSNISANFLSSIPVLFNISTIFE